MCPGGEGQVTFFHAAKSHAGEVGCLDLSRCTNERNGTCRLGLN